jgi:AcrR family transcriptional regulator
MIESYHHGDLKNALIQAGIQILSQEGIHALSLRKVAKLAGVSHAAPYAHFPDKQSLLAAIAAEGYNTLYEQVLSASQQYPDAPLKRLVETAWAYVQFALEKPDHFKITFSGIVEREQDYPDYIAQAKRNLALLVGVIEDCQQAGVLIAGDTELLAVAVWSSIHGYIHLLLGNQLPGTLLERFSQRDLLIFQLQQFAPGLREA